MKIDFTLTAYRSLLLAISKSKYCSDSFINFLRKSKTGPSIILRHDVDKNPNNALNMARLESILGIKSSYYFRSEKKSFHPEIMREISEMGHEIGYHYEDLARVIRNLGVRVPKTDLLIEGKTLKIPAPKPGAPDPQFFHKLAIEDFCYNLEKFRKIVDIKTICMHGSPLSRVDNRDLWKIYDYREFGIIGEPYFDIDFSKVLYLTDTGRRWDGDKFNVRDKVIENIGSMSKDGSNHLTENTKIHTTFDLINAIENNFISNQVMINIHPQRWSNSITKWFVELGFQNIKNFAKKNLVARNG